VEEEPQNVEEIPVPTLPPPPEPDLNGLRRVQDHVEYLLELVEPLKPFGMSVLEAWNQVICEDIDSMINVPPNSTSKVAGYAVRATDLWQNNQVVESLQLATGTEHLGVGQAVPVDVGAELARPGARVDVIGQAPEGWSPQAQDEASQGAPAQNPAEPTETPTTQNSPENSSTMSPSAGPDTSSSSSNQESPGIQEPSQSVSQGMPVGPFGTHSAVLCSGARVMMIQQAGEDGRWTGNKKVTLITLAIPASSATLVVGAATNSTLGIALSP